MIAGGKKECMGYFIGYTTKWFWSLLYFRSPNKSWVLLIKNKPGDGGAKWVGRQASEHRGQAVHKN